MPANVTLPLLALWLMMGICHISHAQSLTPLLNISRTSEMNDQQTEGLLFFDTGDQFIFFELLPPTQKIEDEATFQLEIKKKTINQDRLKPIWQQSVIWNQENPYRDSILLDNKFASGNFELILLVKNKEGEVMFKNKRGIQLLRSGGQVIQDEYFDEKINTEQHLTDPEKTFVRKYDLNTLRKNIAACIPISVEGETTFITDVNREKNPDVLKRFFYNFWYSRNPGNPEAEWLRYAEKLNHVAKNYGTGTLKGYETDRGRIYLVYGEPDELIRLPNEKNALPHEIWSYSRAGGFSNVRFLFYQPGMVGTQMFLLHSTLSREIINPQWRTFIYTDVDDSSQMTHRALEYFK